MQDKFDRITTLTDAFVKQHLNKEYAELIRLATATEIYKAFGIAASTDQGKSKIIRDFLNIGHMDPEWCLPSKVSQNPTIWMITVNGFIVDARFAARPVQEIVYAKGLIPYIPDKQGNPIEAPIAI